MAILTQPSDAELASFVDAYALGSLVEARGLQAGTVNTSYALDLDGGHFFLRIYEEQDMAGATREAAVLAHLAREGVPTPAPVLGKDARPTRTLAGKPAALFPWIAGDMLCQKAVTPASGEAMGAALARVHRAGHAPDAPLDGGRFGPNELIVRCARIERATDISARALAGPLREAVREVAARRPKKLPSGLVHGDSFRDNVLWTVGPDGRCSSIAALLDFESAHDGPFAYDLAVTILSWSFRSTFDADVASAIVRGYRTVRELEPETRAALYDEAILASLRFTITRITDDAIRVGKKWQRFVERRVAIEQLGPRGLLEAVGL